VRGCDVDCEARIPNPLPNVEGHHAGAKHEVINSMRARTLSLSLSPSLPPSLPPSLCLSLSLSLSLSFLDFCCVSCSALVFSPASSTFLWFFKRESADFYPAFVSLPMTTYIHISEIALIGAPRKGRPAYYGYLGNGKNARTSPLDPHPLFNASSRI
jgi:hypothetical protein